MSGSYRILLGVVELIKGKNKNQKDLRIYGRWIRRFGVVSVVGLATLLIFTVAPVIRHSDNAEGVACSPEPCGVDPAGTVTSGLKTATSVLAMTTGRPSADVDLNPTPEGTFVMSDSTHSANFGAYTNNLTGYTLTVAAADDSRQLKNTIGENVVGTLDSISSAVSASTFQNSASYNGKWGYKPSKINSTNNDSFLQAPTTTIQTLNETSCANGTPSCPNQVDEYSIAIAARSDYTKPHGTYTNTLILNMVTNPINYTVHFKDNSGDTVTDIPADINVSSASAINVQLSNRLPSRTNYTFRSWCDGEVTDGGTTCNGTEYPANSVYPLSQSESTYIELTALWYLSMQDMTYSQCTEKPKLAVDNRDGQKYIVKKMADGRCWMLDNLNLGATDISVTLDRSNSNFSSSSVDAATFNGWRKDVATAGTYVDGVMYHVEGTDPTSKNAYGMLYNYYAATGGYTEGATNIVSADYDICPKGWRMPTGGASGEMLALSATFGSTAALQYAGMRAPVSEGGAAFALTGNMAANALPTAAGSTVTDYWVVTDSTNSGNTNYQNAYRVGLRIPASSAAPASQNIARNTGHPIRCVLRPTIENVKYLHEFHIKATGLKYESAEDRKSIIKSMKADTNYVVRDVRDEQEYTIAKLKDGRVWMTKNLNLGATPITVAITATTTAITSNTNSAAGITVANYNSYKKTAFTPSYTAAEYVPVEGYDTTAKTPYGTLYNYMIASATTIKVASQQADAANDICPAGWRLPTGEGFGELNTLYGAYGFNDARMLKSVEEGGAGFARAGTAIGTGQGSTGYYWTSMRGTNADMLAMQFNGNTIYSDTTYDRGSGASIRCILKTSIGDFDNLQDFKNMKSKQRADVVGYMLDRFNYTLKDSRDGQYYTVSKYNDGTVWLSQDLKLTSLSGLTADDTNVTTSRSPYVIVRNSTAITASSSYTTGYIIRPTGEKDATSRSDYGALYNYYAASAGTVSGSSNSTDTLEDICPAGWRLPVGGTTGEFKTLSANANYKTLALLRNPIYSLGAAFSMTGDYSSGMQNQGTSVFYWSSSANDATTRFGFDSTLAIASAVAGTADRNTLHPIRCTLKFTADTLQDFNSATFTANQKTGLKYSMFPGEVYTLVDNRDHRDYPVAKMKDNRVWMADDLMLGADDIYTDLTSANTNLSTARTAAVFNAWKVTSGNTSLTAGEYIVEPTQHEIVYYNFAAASALSIAAASSTAAATYDICPAGWKLPTGNTTGEQGLLYDQYNSYDLMIKSIYLGGAGYYIPGYTTGTSIISGKGRYWSATANTATGRYVMELDPNSPVSVTTLSLRSYHNSVRCISK